MKGHKNGGLMRVVKSSVIMKQSEMLTQEIYICSSTVVRYSWKSPKLACAMSSMNTPFSLPCHFWDKDNT